jgi:protein SCO1/2
VTRPSYQWALALFVTLIVVGCSSAAQPTLTPPLPELRGAVFSPPRQLPDFSLSATTGDTFTLSEHQGEVILLYFGYRTCPDFCPATFAELRHVYRELNEPDDKLKIVFVTVDPERDTLENLALYTHAFHEDFIGLRAEADALRDLTGAFGVVAEKRQVGDSALSYLIDHTASVFLIDQDGRLLAQYLYGTDYRDIIHDVRVLLAET